MRGMVVFVGGTDTGVGKTVVSAAITAMARRDGVDAVAVKPVETGCPGRPGKRRPIDGRFLRLAGGSVLPEASVSLVTLGPPAAPSVAARVEKRPIRLLSLKKSVQELGTRHDLVVVEGAGGLLVPMTSRTLQIDFVASLGCPLLIVGRTALGAVNEMLLSLEAARARKIPIVGWLLNRSGGRFGLAERTAASEIARFADEPFLGILPPIRGLSVERGEFGSLADDAARSVKWRTLLKRIEEMDG